MTTIRVAVLDVGSVKRQNLGWAALDVDEAGPAVPAQYEANTGRDLSALVAVLLDAVDRDLPIALGFECPLYVPVPDDARAINSPRCGEPRDRTFSAAAGATSLVTGLVEVTWILRGLAEAGAIAATVNPERWPEPSRLLLWEGFVSNLGKSGLDARAAPEGWPDARSGEHVRDAATAAKAFAARLPLRVEDTDIGGCGHPFLNTAVTAALRTGFDIRSDELARPCYTVIARD